LGGTRKPKSSIIYETFQGQVEVTSLTRKKVVMSSSDQNSSAISDHNNSAGGDGSSSSSSSTLTSSKSGDEGMSGDLKKHNSSSTKTVSIVDTVQEDEDSGVRMEERWIQEQVATPFLFLSLDIPPTPLFKVDTAHLPPSSSSLLFVLIPLLPLPGLSAGLSVCQDSAGGLIIPQIPLFEVTSPLPCLPPSPSLTLP
jgi:hypothetical protein